MMKNYGNFTTRGGYNMMGGFPVVLEVFALIMMTAITVLAVVLIIKLLKMRRPPFDSMKNFPPVPPVYPSDPLRILDERYAKGEITSEEYFKIKQEILNRNQ